MIMDFACQGFGLDTNIPSFSVPESCSFKWKTPKAEGEIIQIFCVYAREKERERETGNCHESFKTWTQSYTVSLLSNFLLSQSLNVYRIKGRGNRFPSHYREWQVPGGACRSRNIAVVLLKTGITTSYFKIDWRKKQYNGYVCAPPCMYAIICVRWVLISHCINNKFILMSI